MKPDEETIQKIAKIAEEKNRTMADMLRYGIMMERRRCAEIASIPQMSPADIWRCIMTGEEVWRED